MKANPLIQPIRKFTEKKCLIGTFHDISKTAITNWFRQGLSEYDVMTLAGHADFKTTHRFYLAVADDLVGRARQTIIHQVSQNLLQKCCRNTLQVKES